MYSPHIHHFGALYSFVYNQISIWWFLDNADVLVIIFFSFWMSKKIYFHWVSNSTLTHVLLFQYFKNNYPLLSGLLYFNQEMYYYSYLCFSIYNVQFFPLWWLLRVSSLLLVSSHIFEYSFNSCFCASLLLSFFWIYEPVIFNKFGKLLVTILQIFLSVLPFW